MKKNDAYAEEVSSKEQGHIAPDRRERVRPTGFRNWRGQLTRPTRRSRVVTSTGRRDSIMLVELALVEQRYQAVLEVLNGLPVTVVARRCGVARQDRPQLAPSLRQRLSPSPWS